MDNALRHFEAFKRNNIRIVFFPPNCTSWKQPCDMRIIAALKKWCKYLYLKDVLDFYELNDEAKNRKKNQAWRLHQGAVGVFYENPMHMFDVMSYVKDAWDSISQTSIKNAFIKVELRNLEPKLEAGNEVDNLCTEFSKAMESLNCLSIHQSWKNSFILTMRTMKNMQLMYWKMLKSFWRRWRLMKQRWMMMAMLTLNNWMSV